VHVDGDRLQTETLCIRSIGSRGREWLFDRGISVVGDRGAGGEHVDCAVLCLAEKHPPHGAAGIAGVVDDAVHHLTYIHAERAELMEEVLLYCGREGGWLQVGELRDIVDGFAAEQRWVMVGEAA
jgi:hypothetical protein